MSESFSQFNHVVILGGPEPDPALLAIVLDDGEAVPLFDSTEEAEDFLRSTGDLEQNWHAIEVSPQELATLLENQGDEVRHIAVSPPPEDWSGGMEVQVLEREVFTALLHRQSEASPVASEESEKEPESPKRGFFRRLLGRRDSRA